MTKRLLLIIVTTHGVIKMNYGCDNQRLQVIQTLAGRGFGGVKHYKEKGCFIFSFEDNGKKLEATICATYGFIAGVNDVNGFAKVDRALQKEVMR